MEFNIEEDKLAESTYLELEDETTRMILTGLRTYYRELQRQPLVNKSVLELDLLSNEQQRVSDLIQALEETK